MLLDMFHYGLLTIYIVIYFNTPPPFFPSISTTGWGEAPPPSFPSLSTPLWGGHGPPSPFFLNFNYRTRRNPITLILTPWGQPPQFWLQDSPLYYRLPKHQSDLSLDTLILSPILPLNSLKNCTYILLRRLNSYVMFLVLSHPLIDAMSEIKKPSLASTHVSNFAGFCMEFWNVLMACCDTMWLSDCGIWPMFRSTILSHAKRCKMWSSNTTTLFLVEPFRDLNAHICTKEFCAKELIKKNMSMLWNLTIIRWNQDFVKGKNH